MPSVWFTADFHLGHKNIIRYCDRPFDTVEEMNRTILDRLNNLVKANDIFAVQLDKTTSSNVHLDVRSVHQRGARWQELPLQSRK